MVQMRGAWLEQLRLQIPWQSCPNHAVSQGLKYKEMMYVDSLGRGWRRECEMAAEWRGFPQAGTPLCLPWLLVPGSLWGEAGPIYLSLWGMNKIPSGHGVIMSWLVLPVCLFFSGRELRDRWKEKLGK